MFQLFYELATYLLLLIIFGWSHTLFILLGVRIDWFQASVKVTKVLICYFLANFGLAKRFKYANAMKLFPFFWINYVYVALVDDIYSINFLITLISIPMSQLLKLPLFINTSCLILSIFRFRLLFNSINLF